MNGGRDIKSGLGYTYRRRNNGLRRGQGFAKREISESFRDKTC